MQAQAGVRAGGVCLRGEKAPDTPLEYRTGTLRRPYTDRPRAKNVVRTTHSQPCTHFSALDNNTTISTHKHYPPLRRFRQIAIYGFDSDHRGVPKIYQTTTRKTNSRHHHEYSSTFADQAVGLSIDTERTVNVLASSPATHSRSLSGSNGECV